MRGEMPDYLEIIECCGVLKKFKNF